MDKPEIVYMKTKEYTRIGDTVYKNSEITFTNNGEQARDDLENIRKFNFQFQSDCSLLHEYKTKIEKLYDSQDDDSPYYHAGYHSAMMDSIKILEQILKERYGIK